jgi:hypothetical protein
MHYLGAKYRMSSSNAHQLSPHKIKSYIYEPTMLFSYNLQK